MIANNIAYWRSTMNQGKGISRAHLARRVGVGRSFVTKLEKGIAQPGAELMLRIAAYFKQPVEAIFQQIKSSQSNDMVTWPTAIPSSQLSKFSQTVSRPSSGNGVIKDKSLVSPTAKVVACLSRSKPKIKT